jgi:hypothetical protein
MCKSYKKKPIHLKICPKHPKEQNAYEAINEITKKVKTERKVGKYSIFSLQQ